MKYTRIIGLLLVVILTNILTWKVVSWKFEANINELVTKRCNEFFQRTEVDKNKTVNEFHKLFAEMTKSQCLGQAMLGYAEIESTRKKLNLINDNVDLRPELRSELLSRVLVLGMLKNAFNDQDENYKLYLEKMNNYIVMLDSVDGYNQEALVAIVALKNKFK